MTETLIHSVFSIDQFILIIFYTKSDCWQFRVIGLGGVVFGERKLYFSAEAAEKAGREWIAWGD